MASLLSDGITRRKVTRFEKMIGLIVGFYAMNLFNSGAYIAFMLVPVVIKKMVTTKKISIRAMFTSITLFIFSIIYAYMYKFYGFSESITIILGFVLIPTIMYLLGYMFISKEFPYKKTYVVLFSVIYGALLFAVLSVLKTIGIYGSLEAAFATLGRRDIVSFWGENLITVTGLNTYIALSGAMLPTVFFIDTSMRHLNLKKLLIIFGSLASLYIALQSGSRTGVLVIVASCIMSLFLFINKQKNITNRFKLKEVFYAYIIVVLLVFAIIGYFLNIYGIRDSLSSSLTVQRLQDMSALDDPRVIVWGEAIEGVFREPLGGRKIGLSLEYAHNLWLDVGHDAGLIPLILLLIFTGTGFLSIVKFLKTNHSSFLKSTVISSFSAFFIIFLFEPVMQGWFYYFVIYCFFLGVIHKLIFLDDKGELNQTAR